VWSFSEVKSSSTQALRHNGNKMDIGLEAEEPVSKGKP